MKARYIFVRDLLLDFSLLQRRRIMVEADDEYERERQDNIRKNQELLLSLGLSVSSTEGRE